MAAVDPTSGMPLGSFMYEVSQLKHEKLALSNLVYNNADCSGFAPAIKTHLVDVSKRCSRAKGIIEGVNEIHSGQYSFSAKDMIPKILPFLSNIRIAVYVSSVVSTWLE